LSTPPPRVALDHDPFLRELLARTEKAEGRSAARFILVNDTNLLARFGQSVLWMAGEGVVALSGAIDPDLNAPYVQLADRLARKLHAPDKTAPRLLAESDPLLAETEGWQEHLPPHLAWFPLADRVTRKPVGGLLLARDKAWTEGEVAKLAEWCLAWHWAYQAFDRRTFVETAKEFLRGLPAQVGRRPLYWLLGIILIGCFPVRINVLAPAELVPVDPVIVRSPQDGVVKELLVSPNQVVAAGQILMVLDDVPLVSRLDVARQSLGTSLAELRQKEQQALTESEARAALAAARGLVDERHAEVAFLEGQLERTRLRASRPGSVLMDDPTGWAGKPVVTGERIMKIADPDAQKEVEAWISLGDAIPLPPNAELRFYLSSRPLDPITARVRYFSHQSSRLPDGTYAYRVRATPVGPVDQRLGLKGTARVSGGWTPLAYWILRRPLAFARETLGL
jgi:hypothetical protein